MKYFIFSILLNFSVFYFPLTSKAASSISSQRDKAALSVWRIHGFKDLEEYTSALFQLN